MDFLARRNTCLMVYAYICKHINNNPCLSKTVALAANVKKKRVNCVTPRGEGEEMFFVTVILGFVHGQQDISIR